MTIESGGTLAREGWQLVRTMLDDMTVVVESLAETELELLEGLRVLARTTALCSEISVDVDPELPWFFSMNTEMRLIGGPNPDGEYYPAMIDGRRRYRVRGDRGTARTSGSRFSRASGSRPGAWVRMCRTPISRSRRTGRSRSCWGPGNRRWKSWPATSGSRSRRRLGDRRT